MGLFSGLTGSFLAGATERVSANWKEDREKMEAKIAKKTQLFYDDAKLARDKRREEKKAVKQQFEDALGVLGNDPNAGAVAEAMARLTPEQFAETKATLIKVRAEASSKGMGTDLRSLGVISDTPEIEKAALADPATGIVADTISKFKGDSDDAVKRIMGTFEGTKVGVDPKENKNLRQGFLKHVGALGAAGVTSEAEREAAEQLGVTPERLRALRGEGDAFTSGVAPRMAGVNLGVTDPTIRREFETEDREAVEAQRRLDLLNVQIDNARITNKDLTLSSKPFSMTYDGETFTGSAKQHSERLEAITKRQTFEVAEEARLRGTPLNNSEVIAFNRALTAVTRQLGDNSLILSNDVFMPSTATEEDGMLAITIGDLYRSEQQAGLRKNPNQSILDITAKFLDPRGPATDILKSIQAAEAVPGYDPEGENKLNTGSPYLNALNRASDDVRLAMRAKIESLAGITEPPTGKTEALTTQWDATSAIPKLDQRVRAFITAAGLSTELSDRIRSQGNYSDFIKQATGAVRNINMNDAAAVREAILSTARQIEEEPKS
jgi:hypothetical protein